MKNVNSSTILIFHITNDSFSTYFISRFWFQQRISKTIYGSDDTIYGRDDTVYGKNIQSHRKFLKLEQFLKREPQKILNVSQLLRMDVLKIQEY